MNLDERAKHLLLQKRWEAYKQRFGVAGFVDEDGNPIEEFLLSDTHKRILMGEEVSSAEMFDEDELLIEDSETA